MTRLVPLDREDLEEPDREFFDSIQRARGQDPSDRRLVMPDVFRLLLHSPDMASRIAWVPVAIRAGDTLTQDVQEIAVLTVSREAMAPLQWDVHVLRARDAGVREDVIRGIRDHDVSRLDRRERLLVDVVARVCHQRLDHRTLEEVVELVGERATVELVALTGFTLMMIKIVAAFDVPSTVDVDVRLPAADDERGELWSSATTG